MALHALAGQQPIAELAEQHQGSRKFVYLAEGISATYTETTPRSKSTLLD